MRIANNSFTEFDDIDKAPEERERGITIYISHVEYETEIGITRMWICRVMLITSRT